MINAHIILGDYKGHDTKEASSFKIWATIMVSGLERVANGSIDWGDDTEGIPITNGVNAFKHTYSSSGFKKVRFRLLTNGQSIETVGFEGIPKEEITAEIKIPKGGSVI
ncbi:MAG TPA: hypothetical protein ACFYD6_12060 [Candidatus Brocadiia bacterium]|nr:hypothetical protein [Candidatus Brocadiales bacterium]